MAYAPEASRQTAKPSTWPSTQRKATMPSLTLPSDGSKTTCHFSMGRSSGRVLVPDRCRYTAKGKPIAAHTTHANSSTGLLARFKALSPREQLIGKPSRTSYCFSYSPACTEVHPTVVCPGCLFREKYSAWKAPSAREIPARPLLLDRGACPQCGLRLSGRFRQ